MDNKKSLKIKLICSKVFKKWELNFNTKQKRKNPSNILRK